MRLTHVHPRVTPEEIEWRTGFVIERAAQVEETPPPTEREREVLRTGVDPLDVRQLVFLAGSRRREAIEAILRREQTERQAS